MKMKSWDVCPECGARRIAYCRFCNTMGDQFPLAELEWILPPDYAENAGSEDASSPAVQSFLVGMLGSAFAGGGDVGIQSVTPNAQTNAPHQHGGNCGSGGSCSCQNPPTRGMKKSKSVMGVELSQPLDEDPELEAGAEEYPLAVMCPCCDELLYPQFLNVCRCGHKFPDGIDRESIGGAEFYVPEKDSRRANSNDEEDEEDEEYGNEYGSSDGEQQKGCGMTAMILLLVLVGILWFLSTNGTF